MVDIELVQAAMYSQHFYLLRLGNRQKSGATEV